MKGIVVVSGKLTDKWLKLCGAVGQSHLGFLILIKQSYRGSFSLLNHEKIHCAQARELVIIFWYLTYGAEYLVNLCRFKCDHKAAYMQISHELEAYSNDTDFNYLKNRKIFAMWRKKK